MLDKNELERYKRHLILPGFGQEEQEKIKNARVLIVGAGGLGSPEALYLTAAGVGTIGIIDDDVVSESNLQRQILYNSEEIGASKAITAAEKLSKLNSFSNIIPFNERLVDKNALEIIRKFDMVIDGADNFLARYLIDDACGILKKPYVYGSIQEFSGQVSVFNYNNGPTYRCLYPDANNQEESGDIGVMGPLPGMIGSIIASEALKIITGLGEVLSGKLLLMNMLNMDNRTFNIEENPDNRNGKSGRFAV